jgi:hypothetical protein
VNVDLGLAFPILDMKVGRVVIVEKHLDPNPVKLGNLGHGVLITPIADRRQ